MSDSLVVLRPLGHFKSGTADRVAFDHLSDDDQADLMRALRLDAVLSAYYDDPGHLEHRFVVCSHCAQKVNFAKHMEHTATVLTATSPCPYPDGLTDRTLFLDVPSGHMVIANDLRPWATGLSDRSVPSINTALGKQETSALYAEVGIAHWFVGNTNPQIQQYPDGGIAIGGEPVDDGLGFVETSLWWVSVADLNLMQQRGYDDTDHVVVCVPPGRYAFTVFADGFEGRGVPKPVTFSRVGPACPITPPSDPYDWTCWTNTHAHAAMTRARHAYPTLFATPMDALVSALAVVGNGMHWSSGRLTSNIGPEDVPYDPGSPLTGLDPFEGVPSVACSQSPYPMSDVYSRLTTWPDTIDPSWLAAVLIAAKWLYSTRVRVYDRHGVLGEHDTEVQAQQQRIAYHAGMLARSLIERRGLEGVVQRLLDQAPPALMGQ